MTLDEAFAGQRPSETTTLFYLECSDVYPEGDGIPVSVAEMKRINADNLSAMDGLVFVSMMDNIPVFKIPGTVTI